MSRPWTWIRLGLRWLFHRRRSRFGSSVVPEPLGQAELPSPSATSVSGEWKVVDTTGQGVGVGVADALVTHGIRAKLVGHLPTKYDADQRVVVILPFALGPSTVAYEVSPAGQAVDQLVGWVTAGGLLPIRVPRPILVWAIGNDNRSDVALIRDPLTRRVHENSWMLTGRWWQQRLRQMGGDESAVLSEYSERCTGILSLAPYGPTLRNKFIDLTAWLQALSPLYLVMSQALGDPTRWHGLAAVVSAVLQENARLEQGTTEL